MEADDKARLTPSKLGIGGLGCLGALLVFLFVVNTLLVIAGQHPSSKGSAVEAATFLGMLTVSVGIPGALAIWGARILHKRSVIAQHQVQHSERKEQVAANRWRLALEEEAERWAKWLNNHEIPAEEVRATFCPGGEATEATPQSCIARFERARELARPVVTERGVHYLEANSHIVNEISSRFEDLERQALRFLWNGQPDDSKYLREDRLQNARRALEHLQNNRVWKDDERDARVGTWLQRITRAEQDLTPTAKVFSTGRLADLRKQGASTHGVTLESLRRRDQREELERRTRKGIELGISVEEVKERERKQVAAAIVFYRENPEFVPWTQWT